MEKAEAPVSSPSKKKRRRLWFWLGGIVCLAVAAVLLIKHLGAPHTTTTAAPEPPGVPVTTTTARKGDIGVYVEALGTVTPVSTVSVVSRVQGEIMQISYKEGQLVHKGDPLLVIDPRPYQAQLTQAQGQLAHDQALLSESRIDLDRYQAAFSRNAIAKQQVDDQQQLVLQYEGTVRNDEGTVANAQVNLVYCNITSPIDGRVGLRLVDPGNVVQANSTTPLLVITQLQPITVIFSVAEDYLPEIQKQLSNGQRLTVTAFDRTQEKKIADGSLLTIDNQIDTTTGTVKLRAIFENQDNGLFPNQFVNARLLVETEHGMTLVPTAAIQRNAQGAFVYVVGPDQKATLRTVTQGTTDGNTAAVQGVQPNETIVTGGFDKLQDGVRVNEANGNGSATAANTGAGSGNAVSTRPATGTP